MVDIPRKTALLVLNTLSSQNSPHLDLVITDVIDSSDRHLSGQDRKFINTLIFGVLRWQGYLDWIIRQCSNTPLKKIDASVLNILRLGLYQIFFLDRVPDSAAVNTSVELTKQFAPQWIVRYVNAVLRNAGRGKNHLTPPDITDNPADAISVSTAFPLWLIQRWIQRFGVEECKNVCDAFNEIPPITVRCNTLKIQRSELFKDLHSEVEEIGLTAYSPDGLIFRGPKKPIHAFASFKKGYFQVQDEAAQLVAYLLAPKPGEKILDACAGLGGKTGHLVQLMENTGQIIAADRDAKKLSRLNDAMKRLGADIVTPWCHDFSHSNRKLPYRAFDRILVDAPCSGTGVIRRNPDTKWRISEKIVNHCAEKQLKLLCNISPLLSVGGTLVYVVCSFEPEENETVVARFLKTHPHFHIQSPLATNAFELNQFLDTDGFFRSFPHRHDMDGFFAVCLKRVR